MPVWPPDSMARWQELLVQLGTFWQLYYDRPGLLQPLLETFTASNQSIRQSRNTLWSCISRHTVPVPRTQPWATYDDSGNSTSDYPAYTDLSAIPLVLDNPVEPTQVLIQGIDYDFQAGGSFTPLTGLLTQRDEPYWFWWPQRLDTLYQDHLGSVAGLPLTASSESAALANHILDSVISLPTRQDLLGALEVITGVPFAAQDGETVQTTFADRHGQAVVTENAIYRLPEETTLLVAEGDVLTQGQALCDAVRLYIPGVDSLPDSSLVPSLVLDAGMLDASLGGTLTFENSLKSLVVTLNVSGYTKITWAMPDDAGRVSSFFTTIHTRGVAATKTLANWLDLRPQPQVTQPTAASLPASLNPFVLLLETILRNAVFLLVVKTDQLPETALGLDKLSYLRKLLPPWRQLLSVEV